MENRVLFYALMISLVVHFVLLGYLSSLHLKIWQKSNRQVEVTYNIVNDRKIEAKISPVRDLKIIKQDQLPQEMKAAQRMPREFFTQTQDFKSMSQLSDKLSLDKTQALKIATKDMERKITIPVLKSEKITNPKYLSYNEAIRAKIKQRAYAYIDNPEFEAGEVYLTFVLASDGTLKQIKIIDDKTKGNDYLRSVGKKSIEESNPFPPFPSDLNYPELTFNVVISFEIKESSP